MIKVSKANSIRFKASNSLMQNFDNRLSCETFDEIYSYKFTHYFQELDVVPIQVEGDSEPTVTFINENGSETVLTTVDVTVSPENGGLTTFYSYNLTVSEAGYCTIVQGDQKFISEDIDIEESLPIRIEWYNYDNAFGWLSKTSLVNFARFKGYFKEYEPKGKVEIYDNQSEQVKVKETIYRTVKLVLNVVSNAVAEQLVIAAAHDIFVINDVEYITESLPRVKQVGTSSLYDIEFELTEKFAIGTNNFDKNYDPDSGDGYVIATDDYIVGTDEYDLGIFY